MFKVISKSGTWNYITVSVKRALSYIKTGSPWTTITCRENSSGPPTSVQQEQHNKAKMEVNKKIIRRNTKVRYSSDSSLDPLQVVQWWDAGYWKLIWSKVMQGEDVRKVEFLSTSSKISFPQPKRHHKLLAVSTMLMNLRINCRLFSVR